MAVHHGWPLLDGSGWLAGWLAGAAAASLGDLWSLIDQKEYLISPLPDVYVYHIDPLIHKLVILATDGLLNMIEPKDCVRLVHEMSGINHLTMDKAFEIGKKLINK